jgi:hypothetical protein
MFKGNAFAAFGMLALKLDFNQLDKVLNIPRIVFPTNISLALGACPK